ncbi:hypothetical protein BC835DRAFT_1380703 [Cytidiella melzeri]|nr:hypothetical protein BC835DRAFT_1380703 [Cytidiella melzeri]
MHLPPPSATSHLGRTPSRLRTKTSDLSDLLHGRTSSSKPADSDSKGKIAGFLARKRKSGGFALAGGHDGQREEEWTDSDHYPAVPDALARSRLPTAHPPSLPSSLPPLNVSPTSFGTSFASATTETAQHSPHSADPASLLLPAGTTSTPSKHRSAIPFRGIKGQKSMSFEVSRPFNVTHTATATNMAMVNGSSSRIPSAEAKSKSSSSETPSRQKPTITVSAPPSAKDVEEDKDIYKDPRTAPVPPSPSRISKSSKEAHGVARKFGFGHNKKDKEEPSLSDRSKDKHTSPTPSLSPMLPHKMQFPVPPKLSSPAKQVKGGAQVVSTLTDAFQSLSPTPSSLATISPHTATASDMSDGDLSPGSTRGPSTKPSRPMSLIIPNGNRARANSSNTISSTRTAKSPPSSPSTSPTQSKPSYPPSSRLRSTSNRISGQYYSYSYRSTSSTTTTPASPPPRSPLPSPPVSVLSFPGASGAVSSGEEVEVEAGWSTDASTRFGHGGWSTDASTRVGSFAGNRAAAKKAGLVVPEGDGERVRANTITNASAAEQGPMRAGSSVRYHPSSRHHGSGVSSGEETPYESTTSDGRGRKRITEAAPSKLATVVDGERRPRATSETSQWSLPPQPDPSTTPTREDPNASTTGLRAAHETFVRILQEKHVAEKADLLKRIERLEREARKREREIKGLRWLVMNPTGGDGSYVSLLALEEQLEAGRLRSGSKSSEASTSFDGARSSKTDSPAVFTSPANSTEESLIELQCEVSDLIAPSPQTFVRTGDKDEVRPDSSGSLRRSNTVPDREAISNMKDARRRSSPFLPPGGHGLGIVDADIPTIPSGSDMSLTTLAGGGSVSIPSLSLSAMSSSPSSSSSLAAVPEGGSPDIDAQVSRHVEKKERRTSKILKRLSTSSSSSSSSPATSAYSANLKMGMSPSIEQVLDRVVVDETGMDEVLKKLRAFGADSRH